jgi:hypothetical protein
LRAGLRPRKGYLRRRIMIKEIKGTWISPKGSTKLTRFKLGEDIEVNGHGIPTDYITNGGNIPLGFRGIFNPFGEGLPAFIAHDHKIDAGLPRRPVNEEFRRDLKDCGVNARRAYMMYVGVEAYRIVKRIK